MEMRPKLPVKAPDQVSVTPPGTSSESVGLPLEEVIDPAPEISESSCEYPAMSNAPGPATFSCDPEGSEFAAPERSVPDTTDVPCV